ncbi:MAG: hypothetical protein JWN30_2602 [Bacilli bacterium]|nr:hypothetical protein [Bacilli bacterium]
MPSIEDKWIRHLFGRAGFGATPAEILSANGKDYQAIVDSLLGAPVDQDLLPLDLEDKNKQGIAPLQAWWIHRMTDGVNPVLERMILFWHNHFTSAISKVGRPLLMEWQYDLFRKHALGNFRDLAKAVTRDPAMLIWLDGRSNVKKAPNENYAREFMELFSLGIGNYNETDVREAARAFTGLRLDQNYNATFVKSLHDDGTKTILGQTGNFDGDQFIDLVLSKPAALQFLARKFLVNFVIPNPSDQVVNKYAQLLKQLNFEIKPFLRAILTSNEFLSDSAYRSLIKSPVDYVVQLIRSVPSTVSDQDSAYTVKLLGQDLFNSPNVAGWPGGPAWLNATTMLGRFNFVERVVNQCDIAKLFPDNNIVDRALQLAGIPDASAETLNSFAAYSNLPSSNDKTRQQQHLKEVLHLAFSAPEALMK